MFTDASRLLVLAFWTILALNLILLYLVFALSEKYSSFCFPQLKFWCLWLSVFYDALVELTNVNNQSLSFLPTKFEDGPEHVAEWFLEYKSVIIGHISFLNVSLCRYLIPARRDLTVCIGARPLKTLKWAKRLAPIAKTQIGQKRRQIQCETRTLTSYQLF